MFGDVLSPAHVLWCFCGVLAVFRWCFGGIGETVFFLSKMAPPTMPNWRQRRCETLLLGLCAGLINLYVFFLYLFTLSIDSIY